MASQTYSFTAALGTHIGHVRDLNEDSAGISEAQDMFIVADGMGGYEGGEIASSTTVDTLLRLRDEHPTGIPTVEEMQDWLTETNRAAFDISDGKAGTTLTMLVQLDHEGTKLAAINVGDSRIYRYRAAADELMQITEDHSAVQEMVKAGRITPEQARIHPARNIITRAVGSSPRLLADIVLLDAEVGDRFLLSSDGTHQDLDTEEISLVLSSADTVETAASELVERALEEDGSDNITVVVVDVTGIPEQAPEESAPTEEALPPVD